MMLRRKKAKRRADLDQAQREVLLAVKVSDEEIEAASSSPDLYDGLRLRIAAERYRRAAVPTLADRAGLNFLPALLRPRRPSDWILTAAAVLLFVAIGLVIWLPRQSRESMQIAEPVLPQTIPSSPRSDDGTTLLAKSEEPSLLVVPPPPKQQPRTSRRQGRSDSLTGETVTDFFPLTFTADASAPESGHLVRVTIPRSALVAMGLPMNAERAGELVRADVFFGDDGLARAIRFIQ